MFKKTITAILAATMIAGGVLSGAASAAPGKDLRIIPVIVNGQKVKFPDTEPYINTDGRTMVPVRFISEKLGANVKWEEATSTVVIHYSSKEIRMSIGSKTVTLDGQPTELDTAAEKYDGRTMVPLRFVSEVLDSTVVWDEGARAVRVTDGAYQAKLDAGKVALDPWGREYSKTWSARWMKLTDLESAGFYKFYDHEFRNSRAFIEKRPTESYKEIADVLGNKIRNYYAVQLNVDYRTISADKLSEAMMNSFSGDVTKNAYITARNKEFIKGYVNWVKKNKVIAKGYADPELSTVYESGSLNWFPTRFKFMIISANDSSQTFLDNWDVSNSSDSFKLKKGVWYDGYSVIRMTSNVANSTWGESQGIRYLENMFYINKYFYNILE
ncbi:copper amine oxidase N-terminal domain-containing protein [Paenibacillus pinisoli]|nr:copper amine oxidase N-terminal domain-containing protein [Paenibacillus pinisoli]